MAQFKSISQALKKGYKVKEVAYHIMFQDFIIYLRNEDNIVTFIQKSLPKYLTTKYFEKGMINIETEELASINCEMIVRK